MLTDGLGDISCGNSANSQALEADAQAVYDSLRVNEDDGNQWIVAHGLSFSAIDQLDNDRNILGGIPFRFQWERTTGLIRIILSPAHGYIVSDFREELSGSLWKMDFAWRDAQWGMATTHQSGRRDFLSSNVNQDLGS